MLLLYCITEEVIAQEMEKPEFAKFQYSMVPEVGEASWNQYIVAFDKNLFSFKSHEL